MKEPFYQSVRFWTMLATVVVMILSAFVDLEKYGVTQEELIGVLVSVAMTVGVFIWGRTVRNSK